jgi:hypothetical protein
MSELIEVIFAHSRVMQLLDEARNAVAECMNILAYDLGPGSVSKKLDEKIEPIYQELEHVKEALDELADGSGDKDGKE